MQDAITSRDNPLFKRLKKLAGTSRARREARMTLLDGEHLITAYVDAGGVPQTLVVCASCDPANWLPLVNRCQGSKTVMFSDALFAELSPVESPTGILAEVPWIEPAIPQQVSLVLVLEDIQDPGNLGAMLRTGAAAGATLAVLSKACHDPWSPKALRGGQGAQFVLPMLIDETLTEWLETFDGRKIALALGKEHCLYAEDMTGPIALLVGNEGAGLSLASQTLADVVVQIPMPGKVESLNAAAALAVAVFEAVRQRSLDKKD